MIMSRWQIEARRLVMRPNGSGYYSSGHDLPTVVVEARDAVHAAGIGHRLAGEGLQGVTRSIVTVYDWTAEPVTSYRWWLNGSSVTPVPVTRVDDTNADTITWFTADGRKWLRVTRTATGKWGSPVSDVVEISRRFARRRWTSPNGARFGLEDRYGIALDVVNGPHHD